MVEPAGQIICRPLGSLGLRPVANSDNVRCSRTSSVTQRTMSAVESHAFHDHGRMPSAFRRMVGHPRSFADVMQDAGEQQRLVMPVVVPPTAGCFTA